MSSGCLWEVLKTTNPLWVGIPKQRAACFSPKMSALFILTHNDEIPNLI